MQLAALLIALSAGMPAQDTLASSAITAERSVIIARKDTVINSSSLDMGELLRYVPGLYNGDNGGLASLKTVSFRGLGSAHTTVYLDGVRVGNVQSGQSDLGMIPIDEVGKVIVDYAQNSITFRTVRPELQDRKVGGRVSFNAGSFGTYLPSGHLDVRLSDRIVARLSLSGVFSKGDFPYGDGQKRDNNDIRQGRFGADLFGNVHLGDWQAKVLYNTSERGVLGSVSYPSTDRQMDRNALAQFALSKTVSDLYSMNLSAKFSYDDMLYAGSWGDDRYRQTECQVNSAHRFRLSDMFTASLTADLSWDGLKSTAYDASRFGADAALGAAFKTGRFSADAAVTFCAALDAGAGKRAYVSPSLDLRFSALEWLDVVAFGRRAYRFPMFNELYYVGFGNPDLKPEDAWLADVGLDARVGRGSGWSLSARIDGFYDYLKDKIVSAPTEADPNIWLPYNIGRTRILGADLRIGSGYRTERWRASLTAAYTLQDATDVTPDSYSYGTQIAYIPKHSVCLTADAGYGRWGLRAVWNLRAGRTDSYGEMPDWNTLDADLSRDFVLKGGQCISLRIKLCNLTDRRYETVSYYPMPGRSITGGVGFKF